VIPDECQSIPITDPNAWNQNESLSLDRRADVPVIVNDYFSNCRAEFGHPFGKPLGHSPAVQWKVCEPGTLHNAIISRCRVRAKDAVRNLTRYGTSLYGFSVQLHEEIEND
jgi:hypothetical protein